MSCPDDHPNASIHSSFDLSPHLSIANHAIERREHEANTFLVSLVRMRSLGKIPDVEIQTPAWPRAHVAKIRQSRATSK